MRKYDDLTFTDDFLFSRILQADPDLCLEILKRILPNHTVDISMIRGTGGVKISPDGSGVSFCASDAHSVMKLYSLKLLNNYEPFPANRTRFDQAVYDTDLFNKGLSFFGTVQIVISTCRNNFPDRAISTYRNLCLEDRNEELDDGATIIFINPWGKRDNISKKTALFLDYLQGLPVQDPLAGQIDLAVEEAKKNTEWRRDFMLLEERYKNERNAGREEKEAEMLQYLAECQAKGLSLDEAIRMYRDKHPSAL